MPMRQDCKYFESRTYPNGDTVRKCDLDLAPEAPWRCPDDCARFTPRMADVNWRHGSLITPETPDEPASLGDDESIAALLDAAEDIVNEAVPATVADLEAERRKREGSVWRRAASKLPGVGSDGGDGKKSRRGRDRSARGEVGKESLGERFRRRYREGR